MQRYEALYCHETVTFLIGVPDTSASLVVAATGLMVTEARVRCQPILDEPTEQSVGCLSRAKGCCCNGENLHIGTTPVFKKISNKGCFNI